MKNRKGNQAITGTTTLLLAIFIGVIVLAVVSTLLSSVEGQGPCVGPFKGVASVLADMTSADMCS